MQFLVLYDRTLLITYSHLGYTFNVLINSKVPIPVPFFYA